MVKKKEQIKYYCGGCSKELHKNPLTKALVFNAKGKNYFSELGDMLEYERKEIYLSYQLYCNECFKYMKKV
jgi:hypothetical protein